MKGSRSWWLPLALALAAAWCGAPLRSGTNQSKLKEPLAEDRPQGRTETREHGRPVLRVHGHVIKARADLRGLDFRGADLRWVDLRGADLRRADLTGARLCGADLSHAKLAGTILSGADLEEANLFEAGTFGAVGADFSRVHLHPFFSEDRAEAVGAIRLFVGLERAESEGDDRDLVAGPSGNLYWLTGARGRLCHLTTTGVLFGARQESERISDILKTRQFALSLDANHQMVLFGERWLTFFDLDASEGVKALPAGVSPFRATRNPDPRFQRPPLAAFPSPWGSIILAWPDFCMELTRNGDGTTLVKQRDALPGFAAGPVRVRPGSARVHYVDVRDRRLVGVELGPEGTPEVREAWPLAEGAAPDLLALGADGGIWAARRGEGRVVVYAPTPGGAGPAVHDLPAGARIHQLAAGPDGHVWASDPEGDRLLRLAPDGTCTAFPLPRGTRPAELVPYRYGKLLFTTLGGHCLGTLRTVASAGRALPELPFGEEGGAGASAARDEARLEEHLKALRSPEPEVSLASVPAPEGGPVEAPAPAAAGPAPVRPARARLADLGVVLTGGAVQHILARHHAGQGGGNSEFAPAFSHAAGLEGLLAEGLLQAERSGVLGRIRRWDQRERSYTVCHGRDWVGTFRDRGEAVPTRTFLVVTADHFDRAAGRRVQGVVTAYPVAPTW